MPLRQLLSRVGMMAAALGLGAGLAVHGAGCARGDAAGEAEVGQEIGVAARPALPPLDLNAPAEFQTATFAYG